MQKTSGIMWGVMAIVLCAVSAPVRAENTGEQAQGAAGERELIYCADKMTHEEREAYRARMRTARTPEDKAALRQAHRQEMQARARQGGADAECLPQRQRVRGGRTQ